MVSVIVLYRLCVRAHDRNNLVYWFSCCMLAQSTINAADPKSSRVALRASRAVVITASSRAAWASWPSVWPRGTNRTAALIKLADQACRYRCRASSGSIPTEPYHQWHHLVGLRTVAMVASLGWKLFMTTPERKPFGLTPLPSQLMILFVCNNWCDYINNRNRENKI